DPFLWAAGFLPDSRAKAMRALYAFRREIEGIASGGASDLLKQALMSSWRSEIALLYAGQPKQGVVRSLTEPVQLYGLRAHDFLGIINGLELDARSRTLAPSFAELDLGGARAAVALSTLAMRILGLDPPSADRVGAEFGRGAYFTGILRDLRI